MTRFKLLFWSRRSDEDEDDKFQRLYDTDEDSPDYTPPAFQLRETGRSRDMDGDPDNSSAPWWDVELEADGVEAETEDEAWEKVAKYVQVVERRSAAIVVGELAPGEPVYLFPANLLCPACKQDLSGSKPEVGVKRGPRPDDQTVCSFCLTYLRFVDTGEGVLGFHVIERDEFEALPEQHQSALMRVRGVILEHQRRVFEGLN